MEGKDSAMTPGFGLKCPCCEHVFTPEDDVETLYSCSSCGTTYTKANSADGYSHRCPNCNKFGALVTYKACPDCEEELEEVEIAQAEDGEWIEIEYTEDGSEDATDD